MNSIALAQVAVQSGGKRPTEHTYTVVLGTAPDLAYVSSKSEPGKMHTVRGNVCDCTAFGFRADCAHLRAVALHWQAQREATAS